MDFKEAVPHLCSYADGTQARLTNPCTCSVPEIGSAPESGMLGDQCKRAESRAHNQYLSWLCEVAALQASAEVLQLHRCFRGLPALQGFAQAALRAGSAAGKPSVGSLLCDAPG